MDIFWLIASSILIVVPLVFFAERLLNSCPGRKNHEWEYVGTEIYLSYKGSAKCKKYVCKNCGEVKYE
jgi:hypothetical protein